MSIVSQFKCDKAAVMSISKMLILLRAETDGTRGESPSKLRHPALESKEWWRFQLRSDPSRELAWYFNLRGRIY